MNMRYYDIIVAVYQCRKSGDKSKYGPESLDSFVAAAGVSLISTMPERTTLSDMLPEGWAAEHEINHIPFRKIVKIILPGNVEPGSYKIGNLELTGLHSTKHSVNDGMGSSVFVKTKEARLMEQSEPYDSAIDRAIKSGIILMVPEEDGKRHEVQAEVVDVSELYGRRAPDKWEWSE